MVRNGVPLVQHVQGNFARVAQFREVLFGNVVYQRLAVIEATAN